jgi:hypothetical protein
VIGHIVDGFKRMGKNCKSVSVKRSLIKLTNAVENAPENEAVCIFYLVSLTEVVTIYCPKERLRKEIEDFSQCIIPLFGEVELRRKRIQELEEQQHSRSHDLVAQACRVFFLQKEITDLQKSKEGLKRKCMEALDLERIKVKELQSSLAGIRGNLATKEGEYRKVVDSLDRFKSSVCPNQHLYLMRLLRNIFSQDTLNSRLSSKKWMS